MPTLRCISPIDGSVVAEREAATLEAAREAVARARKAQREWANRPLRERVGLVVAGAEALGAMNGEIVPELARTMGRPIRYGGEFGGVRERVEYMASIAEESLADSVVEDSERFRRCVRRVPQGCVLVVAPWNYPYLTAINAVAPALMAGNCVILKHSAQTLTAGERLERAMRSAGIPEGAFRNLPLEHETVSTLLSEGAFDFANFTGSVEAGREIERAAAGSFTAVATELGGKDPGYVMEDADLDAAVDSLMDAALYNSGQCCCGIERIYVHESLYGDFLEKAVAVAESHRLGNPLEEETTLGPMAHERFAEAVRKQLGEAKAAGAAFHVEPSEREGGAYVGPQVLTGVTHEMSVMREESFGPIVGIMKVGGDEEAIRLMNDSEFGLTASLWTSDPERAASVGERVETGTVFMNRADYLDPGLCWTGCKNTGRGASLSHLGFLALTRPKSFHLKKAAR